MKLKTSLSTLFFVCLFFACDSGKKESAEERTETRKESSAKSEPTDNPGNVYFGDTHLHTTLSMDAGAFGNTLGLDEAYQFARGEAVTSTTGLKAKLSRPLDFLVVSDHSDGMGLYQAIKNRERFMDSDQGKRWSDLINSGKGREAALELITNFSQGTLEFDPNDPELMTPLWQKTIDAAEKYNEPGKFTAFIGYEWTSLIKGNNLHRVVIYRDGGDKANQQLPYTNLASPDPEDLWKNLTQYEAVSGGKVLAIPHNGNLSNGMMFAETTVSGESYTEAYVKERMRWEPLYEITQIKGDGEAHPFLSPNDEFADFETWDKGNLDLSQAKTEDMLKHEYGRSALKLGLKIKNKLGTNPYEFGLIGSTDSHTSLPTAEDNNFYGKEVSGEPSKERVKEVFAQWEDLKIMMWETVASGYAAVWAHENTRASIWDAMKRRETYATTGSRMRVRFFGGYDFKEAILQEDWVSQGYEIGVPMGSNLKSSVTAPSFIVHATMDPEGGSLDRIQIVKGWANADGSIEEKVYDVAWAGDRQIGADGKLPAVGNSVNYDDATWSNDIGSVELTKLWVDPDFDPESEAFYYVRVLEIPTPRWTLYDKVRYGAELSEDIPLVAQQRAYSSPIWYSPK